MKLIRPYAVTLCIIDRFNEIKTIYRINDSRTLKIIYNPMEDSFLITFKSDRKSHIVGCKRFNVNGNIYKDYEKQVSTDYTND